MNHKRAKSFWIVGLIVCLISFGLLWLGVGVVLQQTINLQNILAYTLLSIVFGGLSGAFYALEFKAAFTLFVLGLIAGFFMMYWQFIAGLDGWGDLTGLLYLFMLAGMGLVAGLLVQFVWFAIQKSRKRK